MLLIFMRVQNKVISLIKLLVKAFIMMSYVYLREVIHEACVPLTWFRLIYPLLFHLSLTLNGNRLNTAWIHLCKFMALTVCRMLLLVFSWMHQGISWLNEPSRLWTFSTAHWIELVIILTFLVPLQIIIGHLCSMTSVYGVQSMHIVVAFWSLAGRFRSNLTKKNEQ